MIDNMEFWQQVFIKILLSTSMDFEGQYSLGNNNESNGFFLVQEGHENYYEVPIGKDRGLNKSGNFFSVHIEINMRSQASEKGQKSNSQSFSQSNLDISSFDRSYDMHSRISISKREGSLRQSIKDSRENQRSQFSGDFEPTQRQSPNNSQFSNLIVNQINSSSSIDCKRLVNGNKQSNSISFSRSGENPSFIHVQKITSFSQFKDQSNIQSGEAFQQSFMDVSGNFILRNQVINMSSLDVDEFSFNERSIIGLDSSYIILENIITEGSSIDVLNTDISSRLEREIQHFLDQFKSNSKIKFPFAEQKYQGFMGFMDTFNQFLKIMRQTIDQMVDEQIPEQVVEMGDKAVHYWFYILEIFKIAFSLDSFTNFFKQATINALLEIIEFGSQISLSSARTGINLVKISNLIPTQFEEIQSIIQQQHRTFLRLTPDKLFLNGILLKFSKIFLFKFCMGIYKRKGYLSPAHQKKAQSQINLLVNIVQDWFAVLLLISQTDHQMQELIFKLLPFIGKNMINQFNLMSLIGNDEDKKQQWLLTKSINSDNRIKQLMEEVEGEIVLYE